MRVDVVTIFPDYLAPLRLSLIGRAVEDGLLDLAVHDLRDWTTDRHRTVDDTPYGGGPGMLMRPEPWGDALDAVLHRRRRSSWCRRRAARPSPRRWRTSWPPRSTWSSPAAATRASTSGCSTRRPAGPGCSRSRLGDYVLNGGEVAVLAIVEAVARLLPGVIGNAESLVDESHSAVVGRAARGARLHQAGRRGAAARCRRCCSPATTRSIARWRRDQALRRTSERRPDLLAALDPAALDRHDLALLAELGWVVGPRRSIGPRLRPCGRLTRPQGPAVSPRAPPPQGGRCTTTRTAHNCNPHHRG